MAEEILLYHPLTRTVVENKAERDSHAAWLFPHPQQGSPAGAMDSAQWTGGSKQ